MGQPERFGLQFRWGQDNLPYAAKRLCVADESKKSSGTRSGNDSSYAGTEQFSKSSKVSSKGSSWPANSGGRGSLLMRSHQRLRGR